jgi:hypothetical protein
MKYNSKEHYLRNKHNCCNKEAKTKTCHSNKKCTIKKQRVSNLKIGHSERAVYLIKRIYPYFKSISDSDGTFNIHPHDSSRSFAIHKKSMDYIIGCKNETNIDSKSFDNCKESNAVSLFGNEFIKIEKLYERIQYNEEIGGDSGDGTGDSGDGTGDSGDGTGEGGYDGTGDGGGDGTGDGGGDWTGDGGCDGTGDGGGDVIDVNDEDIDELINELTNIFDQNELPDDELIKNVRCHFELPRSEILEEINQQFLDAFNEKIRNLFPI